jgi:hypothetical protein
VLLREQLAELSPNQLFNSKEKMKRGITGRVQLVMNIPWKLGKVILVGLVLAASYSPRMILAADTSQNSSETHARITRVQAERAALLRVPGGKIKSAKLQRENGVLIWSVDIITPLTKKVAAVQVDAYTGKVLSKLAQNPADRAEESVGQK